jgi:hypothetical protein
MDALKRRAEWEGLRCTVVAIAASERSSARWSSLDVMAGLSVVLVTAQESVALAQESGRRPRSVPARV